MKIYYKQIGAVVTLITGVNLVVLDGVVSMVGAALLGAFVVIVTE